MNNTKLININILKGTISKIKKLYYQTTNEDGSIEDHDKSVCVYLFNFLNDYEILIFKNDCKDYAFENTMCKDLRIPEHLLEKDVDLCVIDEWIFNTMKMIRNNEFNGPYISTLRKVNRLSYFYTFHTVEFCFETKIDGSKNKHLILKFIDEDGKLIKATTSPEIIQNYILGNIETFDIVENTLFPEAENTAVNNLEIFDNLNKYQNEFKFEYPLDDDLLINDGKTIPTPDELRTALTDIEMYIPSTMIKMYKDGITFNDDEIKQYLELLIMSSPIKIDGNHKKLLLLIWTAINKMTRAINQCMNDKSISLINSDANEIISKYVCEAIRSFKFRYHKLIYVLDLIVANSGGLKDFYVHNLYSHLYHEISEMIQFVSRKTFVYSGEPYKMSDFTDFNCLSMDDMNSIINLPNIEWTDRLYVANDRIIKLLTELNEIFKFKGDLSEGIPFNAIDLSCDEDDILESQLIHAINDNPFVFVKDIIKLIVLEGKDVRFIYDEIYQILRKDQEEITKKDWVQLIYDILVKTTPLRESQSIYNIFHIMKEYYEYKYDITTRVDRFFLVNNPTYSMTDLYNSFIQSLETYLGLNSKPLNINSKPEESHTNSSKPKYYFDKNIFNGYFERVYVDVQNICKYSTISNSSLIEQITDLLKENTTIKLSLQNFIFQNTLFYREFDNDYNYKLSDLEYIHDESTEVCKAFNILCTNTTTNDQGILKVRIATTKPFVVSTLIDNTTFIGGCTDNILKDGYISPIYKDQYLDMRYSSPSDFNKIFSPSNDPFLFKYDMWDLDLYCSLIRGKDVRLDLNTSHYDNITLEQVDTLYTDRYEWVLSIKIKGEYHKLYTLTVMKENLDELFSKNRRYVSYNISPFSSVMDVKVHPELDRSLDSTIIDLLSNDMTYYFRLSLFTNAHVTKQY